MAAVAVAGILLASVTLYALLGGADVGGGLWDLLAGGDRRGREPRALIEESIARSKEGSMKLQQVAASIHQVTTSSTHVKTLVDEVNVGSQEQARGIEQIAAAIGQMEQVTLSMKDGATIVWGDPSNAAAKNRELGILLRSGVSYVNVSAPTTVVTR